MPNWCENAATIRHSDPEMISKIFEIVTNPKNEVGLFGTFYPIPLELQQHHAPVSDASLAEKFLANYGAKDWYDWCVKNWGTKWDVTPEAFELISPNEIRLGFDTAWAPPSAFYTALSTDHGYEIEAKYFEPGVGFCGRFESVVDEDEAQISEDHFDYDGEDFAEWLCEYDLHDLEDCFGMSTYFESSDEEEEEDEDEDSDSTNKE